MKQIGLLMIREENDILAETLARHCELVDAFYVLDGTNPSLYSSRLCERSGKCAFYLRDVQLTTPVTDGARQVLYEAAVADNGHDNWFLLLHGDEVWTADPRQVVREHPGADGFIFNLPCYFPRAGQRWDAKASPLKQLRWNLRPGWPEFRMFRGSSDVYFDRGQHFDVTPKGLRNIARTGHVIKHYPYRSPESQQKRSESTFDPDNYQDARSGLFFWTDEKIARWRRKPCWRELAKDTA